MKEPNIRPWFGLDDLGGYTFDHDEPKPLYNEKDSDDQEKALNNPEQSIDKDPNKPWVQKNERQPSIQDTSDVNDRYKKSKNEPPIDNWAKPEKREDIPDAR